jgi:general stress protein 26
MNATRSERDRVRQLLQRAGVAMLMTIGDSGVHAGRPMLPLFLAGDPHVYFLTHAGSRKVKQITAEPQVALTMVSSGCFFCLVGFADAVRDPGLIRRLWHPSYRAWFPAGQTDRQAVALRVAIASINYWEPPRNRAARVFQAIKAIATRRPVDTPMKTIDGL